MKSRARVEAALSHQEPDALPIDFGSTAVTGLHLSAVAALRDHSGLEDLQALVRLGGAVPGVIQRVRLRHSQPGPVLCC